MESTTKKLYESEFSKKLMRESLKIVNKWSLIHSNNMENDSEYYLKNRSFNSVGNIDEQKYYQKTEKFLAIQSTLEDINKVFIFLKIDRNKILENYPEINSQENYFKYHIENYIVRIYTIVDLIGKLGNLLYETKIPDDDCNCYKFKEKIKKDNIEIGKLIEDILDYIDEIKKRRNKKIHTGIIEITELNGISFWEDFSEFLSPEFNYKNPIINLINEENFNKMIQKLYSFLDLLIEKIICFLNKSLNRI